MSKRRAKRASWMLPPRTRTREGFMRREREKGWVLLLLLVVSREVVRLRLLLVLLLEEEEEEEGEEVVAKVPNRMRAYKKGK
jgi:hypothetical protein